MCTTPKFCIALALGVPCVSMSWLEACFNQARRVEWLPYLLPRGVSNVLHITLSQQVDIDWGDCKEDLDQLLSRPYVTKYFEGKAIALVVRDVRKYSSGAAQRALMPMPRILLSMGAGSVVVPLGAFDTILYKKYDWVVFEDETKVPSSSRNAVSWDWVKECLIANRILPV
ncbi:hypothetical protein FISHEDRAFT_53179 [Fistulina hepatica ATCC 64428]|nr:hypothetical protein FISHEDRAFT_53179 [Fistulina hepatica ATCC 64428]